jgi:peptidoglycan/xylan/chitin deacetylase (PgdA/CDA1 family)
MARDVVVLCYHALSERWPASFSTTPDRFEAQLSLLKRRGYRGITFQEAARGPDAERAVAITFDDAFRSVLDLGRPILDRLGMPGTVFVPTALAGGQEPMSWDGVEHWLASEHADELLPMSWDDLRELAGAGWEIGSHTRTHPRLTLVDDGRLADELVGSREDCERELAAPCRSLAYTYGDPDQRVVDAARAAGYAAAATLPGPQLPRSPDPHLFPREGIYHDDGRLRFELKVSPAVRRFRTTRVWRALNRDPGVSAS